MGEAKTEMSYEDLMLTQKLIQDSKDLLEKYGLYPVMAIDVDTYNKANVFLMHVSQLYFECAGCGRMVAPDEERYQDPASENWYCVKCLNEGI